MQEGRAYCLVVVGLTTLVVLGFAAWLEWPFLQIFRVELFALSQDAFIVSFVALPVGFVILVRYLWFVSRVIKHAGIIAHHVGGEENEWIVPSAIHVEAGVEKQYQLPSPPEIDEEAMKTQADREWEVVNLLQRKISYHAIADITGIPYNQIQKIGLKNGFGKGKKAQAYQEEKLRDLSVDMRLKGPQFD